MEQIMLTILMDSLSESMPPMTEGTSGSKFFFEFFFERTSNLLTRTMRAARAAARAALPALNEEPL
jgi:hypothetical protein